MRCKGLTVAPPGARGRTVRIARAGQIRLRVPGMASQYVDKSQIRFRETRHAQVGAPPVVYVLVILQNHAYCGAGRELVFIAVFRIFAVGRRRQLFQQAMQRVGKRLPQ